MFCCCKIYFCKGKDVLWLYDLSLESKKFLLLCDLSLKRKKVSLLYNLS